MKTIKQMAEFHLEAQCRDAYRPEPALQITSRIPADLKIRLDTSAKYLGLTRNALLIDILELALPEVEAAIGEHSITLATVDANGERGPFTYSQAVDWAMSYFHETGKAPKSNEDVLDDIHFSRKDD